MRAPLVHQPDVEPRLRQLPGRGFRILPGLADLLELAR
jgi:hypothetical protein